MVKYTHLTERCSGFLRTGAAWKLKEHGYTFSAAYWRLREGKGLMAAYDQESLKRWSSLITGVRRGTAPVGKLKSEDQAALKAKKESLLQRMEEYRDWLEQGARPQYLHDGTSPMVMEHLLAMRVGDPREATPAQQQEIWESLDINSIIREAEQCLKDIKTYADNYAAASDERKGMMQKPEEWTAYHFGRRFVKEKVWQIRTGHDERSSVGAGINDRLNFIWNIPSRTDNNHRTVYEADLVQLESYRQWKEANSMAGVPYEMMLAKVQDVLDNIRIPDFE